MNGFFGVGPLEMLVIAVLALIFIGPQRLPEVIRQVMKTVRELREYASQVQDELTTEFAPMREELQGIAGEMNTFTQDVASQASEVASEARQAAADVDVRPEVNQLMAPPPPRGAPLSVPAGTHTNGVAHDDDEVRPAFGDYHPQ